MPERLQNIKKKLWRPGRVVAASCRQPSSFSGKTPGCSHQAEILPGHGGCGESSDLRHVMGRCDLHNIGTAEIQPAQATEDALHLPAGEATHLRRAGAGREGRVERI